MLFLDKDTESYNDSFISIIVIPIVPSVIEAVFIYFKIVRYADELVGTR